MWFQVLGTDNKPLYYEAILTRAVLKLLPSRYQDKMNTRDMEILVEAKPNGYFQVIKWRLEVGDVDVVFRTIVERMPNTSRFTRTGIIRVLADHTVRWLDDTNVAQYQAVKTIQIDTDAN